MGNVLSRSLLIWVVAGEGLCFWPCSTAYLIENNNNIVNWESVMGKIKREREREKEKER